MRYFKSKHRLVLFLLLLFSSFPSFAKNEEIAQEWLGGAGVIGMLVLIALALAVPIIVLLVRFNKYLKGVKRKRLRKQRLQFDEEIISLKVDEIDKILEQRKEALNYKLTGN